MGHLPAFFSRKLQGKNGLGQRNWSVRDKEMYALVCCAIKFKAWFRVDASLQHSVYTDHQSLASFQGELDTISAPRDRRLRWFEHLSIYNFLYVYLPGPENIQGDTASRWMFPAILEDISVPGTG